MQELQGDSPPSPPPPAKTKEVHIPPVATPSTKPQSGELQTVLDRQKMYETALTSAKQAGESSKARRYERSVKTINTMAKQLKAGKKVDIEDLPPPVAIAAGGGSKGVEPPTPAPRPAPRQGMLFVFPVHFTKLYFLLLSSCASKQVSAGSYCGQAAKIW